MVVDIKLDIYVGGDGSNGAEVTDELMQPEGEQINEEMDGDFEVRLL
jgi:hypothetical protein